MTDDKTIEELVSDFMAQIEAKELERRALDRELGAIYKAAKKAGLNHKIIRRIVLMRIENEHLRQGGDVPLQMYMQEMKVFNAEQEASGRGTRATRRKNIAARAEKGCA